MLDRKKRLHLTMERPHYQHHKSSLTRRCSQRRGYFLELFVLYSCRPAGCLRGGTLSTAAPSLSALRIEFCGALGALFNACRCVALHRHRGSLKQPPRTLSRYIIQEVVDWVQRIYLQWNVSLYLESVC